MACQFPLAIGSNYVKGSVPKDPTVEKDEIFNTYGERENLQVIPKFDLAIDTTDTKENDSYCNDENDEYTNPTCNDSTPDDYEDVEVRYTSIEATIVNQLDKNDTITELEMSMSREWNIPSCEDYSIRTIPTLMSVTSDNGIYKVGCL